jgi:hypothetical protein
MKKYIIGLVVILAVVGFAIMAAKNNGRVSNSITKTDGSYCSSEGKLTNTKPIQSHRSYCIKPTSDTSQLQPKASTTYSYKIIDDRGETLYLFDTVHEKTMHLIVARKDLNDFQHLHPSYNASGEFTLNDLKFASDGSYRIFADFTPSNSQQGADGEKLPVTVYQDVNVGDLAKYKPQSIGVIDEVKTFQGYDIQMTNDPQLITAGSMNMVSFDIKKDGKAVTNLENYLGALGHSVVLREGTLDFIHAHPLTTSSSKQTGRVDFHVNFPTEGKYKLFTQFQHQGQLITSDFVVSVAKGVSQEMMDDMTGGMEGMDH